MSREAHHGGIDLGEIRRRGIDPVEVTDLSTNVLAVRHPTEVCEAIAAAVIDAYPDRNCHELRDALSAEHRTPSSRILVGCGCSELIHLIAQSFLHRNADVLVVGPTFAEYRRASELTGAIVREIRSEASSQFTVPYKTIEQALSSGDFRLVWICNPNNPTGQTVSANEIQRWLQQYPGTIFVVDESYIEFSQETSSIVALEFSNLIVLRSMTKCFALAGLRLGFAVASESAIEAMRCRRVPWSVSSVAQAAGLAVLRNREYYRVAMRRTWKQRRSFCDALRARGYEPLASDTGFILLPVNDAKATRERWLDQGVLVRDATSFGLPHHVRIAVGDCEAMEKLLRIIDQPKGKPIHAPEGKSESERRNLVELGLRGKQQASPLWDELFRRQLHELFRLRRDVRRFRTTPIQSGILERLIHAACLAPSVGLSEPWRFITVRGRQRREQIIAEFESANAQAASQYDVATATEYQQLKLAGLREAPEHLAVFVQPDPESGRGLGRQTMPETVAYSVVAAIQNLWLAARAENLGVGWVSILNAEKISEILDVPHSWQMIAYLCIGYPEDASQTIPELEVHCWQERKRETPLWRR